MAEQVPEYEYKEVAVGIAEGMHEQARAKYRAAVQPQIEKLKAEGWEESDYKQEYAKGYIIFRRPTGEMVEAPPEYEKTSRSIDVTGMHYEGQQRNIWRMEKPLLEQGWERSGIETVRGYPGQRTYIYRRPVGVTEAESPPIEPGIITARKAKEASGAQEEMYPEKYYTEAGKKELLDLKKLQPSTAEQVFKGEVPERYNIQTVEHGVLQSIGKEQGILPSKDYPEGIGGFTDKQKNILISGAQTEAGQKKLTTHEILHNIYPTFSEQEIRQMTEKQISALGDTTVKISSAPPKASSFIQAAQKPEMIPTKGGTVSSVNIYPSTIMPSGASVSQKGQMTSIPVSIPDLSKYGTSKPVSEPSVQKAIPGIASSVPNAPKITTTTTQVGQVTLTGIPKVEPKSTKKESIPSNVIKSPTGDVLKFSVTPMEAVELASKLAERTAETGEVIPAVGEIYKTLSIEPNAFKRDIISEETGKKIAEEPIGYQWSYVIKSMEQVKYEQAQKAFEGDPNKQLLAAKLSTSGGRLGWLQTAFEEFVETPIFSTARSITEGIPITEAYDIQKSKLYEMYKQQQIGRITTLQQSPESFYVSEGLGVALASGSIALSAAVPSIGGVVKSASLPVQTAINLAKVPVGTGIAVLSGASVIKNLPRALTLEPGSLLPTALGGIGVVGGTTLAAKGVVGAIRGYGEMMVLNPRAGETTVRVGAKLMNLGKRPPEIEGYRTKFVSGSVKDVRSIGKEFPTSEYGTKRIFYMERQGDILYPTSITTVKTTSGGREIIQFNEMLDSYRSGLYPYKPYDIASFYGGKVSKEGILIESVPTRGQVSQAITGRYVTTPGYKIVTEGDISKISNLKVYENPQDYFNELIKTYPSKVVIFKGSDYSITVGGENVIGEPESFADLLSSGARQKGLIVSRYIKGPSEYTPDWFKPIPQSELDKAYLSRAFDRAISVEYGLDNKIFNFEMGVEGIKTAGEGNIISIGGQGGQISESLITTGQFISVPSQITTPIPVYSYTNVPSFPSAQLSALSLVSSPGGYIVNIPSSIDVKTTPTTEVSKPSLITGSSVLTIPTEPKTEPSISLVAPPQTSSLSMPDLIPETSPITQPKPTPRIEPMISPATMPIVSPRSEPMIEPISEPVITPRTEPIIEPFIEPRAEPKIEPEIMPIIQPRVEPRIEPRVEPRIEPKITPRVQPRIQPRIHQIVETRPTTTIPMPKIYWGGKILSKPKKERVIRKYRYTPTVAGVFSGKTIKRLPKIGPKEATFIRYPKQRKGSFIMKGLKNLFSRPKYKTDKKGKKSYLNNFDKALGL